MLLLLNKILHVSRFIPCGVCDEHVGLDSCSVACQVCEAWHHISCTHIQIQVSIDNDNLILGKKYLGIERGREHWIVNCIGTLLAPTIWVILLIIIGDVEYIYKMIVHCLIP